jgi:hypothetical protein
LFHITKDTKLVENWIIASLIFLFISLIFVIITFYIINFCICKARKKEFLVVEDGIDSPPRYCMEEPPPTYEEAIKIESI